MSKERSSAFAWWCAGTIFVSAFLLFQVQPVISKMILPWFGGTPAVWTVCMLFFQLLLLGGYAYAHFLAQLKRAGWQTGIHIVLLIAALAMLPITPGADWKPTDSDHPTTRILLLLLAHVGLPYFLLSSTGPLIQAWYSMAYEGHSPYRLYALSNIGSLGALLTYPFLFEPAFSSPVQGTLWSVGFGIFAAICGYLAFRIWRIRGGASLAVPGPPSAGTDADAIRPTLGGMLIWLTLPACASMMLLATTNHVCQDVAVTPFFWVVPLSLYLLSFIICFDNERWYVRGLFGIATAVAILALSTLMIRDKVEDFFIKYEFPVLDSYMQENGLPDLDDNIVLEAGLYMIVLFLICMLCHGELVRRKPAPRYLTSFYLMVAAGGALGGIFVGLVCPIIFSTFLEMNLGLAIGFLLSMLVIAEGLHDSWILRLPILPAAVAKAWRGCLYVASAPVMILAFVVVVTAQLNGIQTDALVAARNFYGVLRVEESDADDPEYYRRALYHGRILHGMEFMGPDRQNETTTYYGEGSGVNIAMNHYPSDRPRRVGVIGLGTGTMASLARPGDYFRFYDINPQVVVFAQKYFKFLETSQGDWEIVMGDARLSMEKDPPQNLDILVMDAFSGDAIPAHLLTLEAFKLYLTHMNPEGIIAVHISNRHLDLTPVVGGIADALGMHVLGVDVDDQGGVADAGSTWLLMTNNETFLQDDMVLESASDIAGTYQPIPLWTDQYSNLFQIMRELAHARKLIRGVFQQGS